MVLGVVFLVVHDTYFRCPFSPIQCHSRNGSDSALADLRVTSELVPLPQRREQAELSSSQSHHVAVRVFGIPKCQGLLAVSAMLLKLGLASNCQRCITIIEKALGGLSTTIQLYERP